MNRLDRATVSLLGPRVFAWGAIFLPAFAFAAPKIAYWPLVFGGVAAMLRFAARRAVPPRAVLGIAVWAAAMLVWIALSSLYALDRSAGLVLALKLSAYAACGLALIGIALEHGDAMRRSSGNAHIVSGLVLAALMVADFASGGALSTWLVGTPPGSPIANRNTTATLYLAAFAWPLSAWLRDHGPAWRAALPPLVALMMAGLFSHVAVLVAVAAGGLVLVFALARPRATGIVLAASCAGLILLSPVVGKLVTPGPWLRAVPAATLFSVYHRTKIWSFTAGRIAERPLLGWGADASRRIPGGDAVVDINRDLGFADKRYDTSAVVMPLHPHSAALQVWLELGAVGALLLAVLCCGVPLVCLRALRSRTSTAGGLAAFTTVYVLAMTSFSLWQSRWHTMLWLAGVSALVLLGGAARAAAQPTSER